MAYAQANCGRSITSKAALLVAFFASFFTLSVQAQSADPFVNGTITFKDPKIDTVWSVTCQSAGTSVPFGNEGGLPLEQVIIDSCGPVVESGVVEVYKSIPNNVCGECNVTSSYSNGAVYLVVTHPDIGEIKKTNFSVSYSDELEQMAEICPPDEALNFSAQYTTSDGSIQCYDPAQYEQYLLDKAQNSSVDEFCSRLVLDSGNNSADAMCYTAPSGVSCDVFRQDGSDYSYYIGAGQNIEGCAVSDDPPYDGAGTGDGSDGCFSSGGINYCEANKSQHCTNVQGSEICDDGCLETQAGFYCDAARHPDVGEGESDYFDDNGTCSIVAGSAYRGVCEELGGEWSKEGDYTESSCPPTSIAGSCSISVVGGCASCLDSGGEWTPDPNADLTNTEKGLQDIAALTQDTNNKLNTLELTNRKGNEALISTIKSGNDKLVSAVKGISSGGGGGSGAAVVAKLDEIEEKKKYTTTTQDKDKSKFNSMFDEAAIAKLNTEVEALQTELSTQINTIKGEASTLMSITVPSASGYTARNLSLTQGTFDISLSRFSSFFALLAAPILLGCSILAAFIILGGKD